MANIYLTVPFKEKDSVKALGARWDADARRWYVPDGQDLVPFTSWLPGSPQASTSRDIAQATQSTAVQAAPRGMPLSRLLHGVAKAVADAYSAGVWTTAEVLRASARDGHVYLELSERDADGRVLAKANAAIWARTAERIVPEFERATGATLGAGIKLLVRARPVYKPQFGFTLDIDAIDPTYTLGDLEAKKRELRERLKREQLFDLNKRLPAPWDFFSVLVVAPQGGAGLGDFAKEADRLALFAVCRFTYVHSRFQGEGAAGEILEALMAGLAQFSDGQSPDAVILIRGGGAVNDLAWLNDYPLARFICECPVPVLTGIGHERDSTVLDEVAHMSFDTPSKVVAGIEQLVIRRAREARSAFEGIVSQGRRDIDRMQTSIERIDREVKAAASSTLADARAQCAQLMADLRLDSVRVVHRAARYRDKIVKRWLISGIVALYSKKPTDKFELVLTFQGFQGKGKTTWFQRLVDPSLNAVLESKSGFDPGNKDHVFTAAGHFIVELGEIDTTFSKSDIGKIKAHLSASKDKARRPYAKTDSELKRQTIYGGTVNRPDCLIDDENRRFPMLAVIGIDYMHKIDMQQLWAEVKERFFDSETPEQHWLTDSERAELDRMNERFEAVSPIAEMLTETFDFPTAALSGALVEGVEGNRIKGTVKVTATQVAAIFDLPRDRKTVGDAAQALRKLTGEDWHKSNGQKVWRVSLKPRSQYLARAKEVLGLLTV